jgi:hypothetical protein
LVIPIGIHLLSRKEGKVIPIGSVRHLLESETAQFSSIRLNEIFLLILRCLIIVLITFLLAGINVNLFNREKTKWLVVDAEIEKQIAPSTLDSLEKQGYEKHYLADNFPISDNQNQQKQNNWYLAEQLGKTNIDAVVFSSNTTRDFFGERISKPENIRWITVEPEDTVMFFGALDLSQDSVWVRTGISSGALTQLTAKQILKVALDDDTRGSIQKNDSITAAIYFTPNFANDAKIIQACLLTIRSVIPVKLKIEQNPPKVKGTDWVFWLSNETIRFPGEKSFFFFDLNDRNISMLTPNDKRIYKTNINAGWMFTRRLTQADAIQEKLPMKLASILLPKVPNEKYLTTLPEESTWSPTRQRSNSQTAAPSQTLNVILFFLISTVALLERWVAYKRKI